MTNIDKRFKELSPYVLSIRFTNNISVIDTEFKQGWELPSSNDVGYEAVPNRDNTYMLYPKNENVGADEILDYVAYVIKVNVEREQKIELLQVKINELKHIFTKQSLQKCKNLKFTFQELLTPDLSNEEISLPIMSENEKDIETEKNQEEKIKITDKDLDEVPIAEMPEVDPEVKRFNEMNNKATVNNETFDLPPKNGKFKAPELETFDEPNIVCQCDPNDPNQVCPVCVDEKL